MKWAPVSAVGVLRHVQIWADNGIFMEISNWEKYKRDKRLLFSEMLYFSSDTPAYPPISQPFDHSHVYPQALSEFFPFPNRLEPCYMNLGNVLCVYLQIALQKNHTIFCSY